jgi:hypothetical protein
MTWTQSILDDEKHFPQKIGTYANTSAPIHKLSPTMSFEVICMTGTAR